MKPEQRRHVVWEVAHHMTRFCKASREAVFALHRAFENDRAAASAVAHSYYLFEPFGSLERQVTMLAYLASKAEVSEMDVSIARDVLGDEDRFNAYCRDAAGRTDLT
jgi:hypothetical protein